MKAWWQRRTLRFRLALWYAVGGTLLLAAFSATLYLYVEKLIAQPFDEGLREELANVRARLKVLPGGRLLWDGKEVPAGASRHWRDPWLEVWDADGNLVRRLWPLDNIRLDRLPGVPRNRRETVAIFNVTANLRLQVLTVPYEGPGGEPGWALRVMRANEPAGDALSALLLIIIVALPVVVTLLVLVGYSLTRHWLKPLDDMVAEAHAITAEDLGRRMPVVNPHDELGRLATVFNVTLDRLENSFETLNRFAADASHELRTPLTTLRSVGEVGLKRSRTVEEYREIIASMLEETQRLQLLTHRLLELARAESGAELVHRQRLRLDELVTGCVQEMGVLAEDKEQSIALKLTACSVVTDPVILRQAFENLIDNAIKYSPGGTTINVTVSQARGVCCITVSDEGPGIAPEHRPYIAGRFFRTGGARGRGKAGFGLGLAITNAYMRVLGGSLNYQPAPLQGSVFSLILPAA